MGMCECPHSKSHSVRWTIDMCTGFHTNNPPVIHSYLQKLANPRTASTCPFRLTKIGHQRTSLPHLSSKRSFEPTNRTERLCGLCQGQTYGNPLLSARNLDRVGLESLTTTTTSEVDGNVNFRHASMSIGLSGKAEGPAQIRLASTIRMKAKIATSAVGSPDTHYGVPIPVV